MEDHEPIWRLYGESLIVDERVRNVYAGPQACELPFPAPCFVITAWNPMSEQSNEVINRQRNEDLLDCLERCTSQIRRVTGQSACGDWKEASFLVADMEERKVLDLANRFRQRAIFRLDNERKFVVDSDGKVRNQTSRCQ